MDFYITPDEYELAAQNGISEDLLNWRIRNGAWSKAKAINTPPRKRTNRKVWRKVAEQNGIPYYLLLVRINAYGWSEERAATEPMITTSRRIEIMKKAKAVQQKFSPELIELAKQNGIKPNTFYNRVKLGWDLDRAATEHLWSDSKKGTTSVRKIRERYGDMKA